MSTSTTARSGVSHSISTDEALPTALAEVRKESEGEKAKKAPGFDVETGRDHH